jgi:hypothetical protein
MKSTVLVAMCYCAVSAHATLVPLLTNGDIETGDLSPWTSTTQSFGNITGACDDAFAVQSTAAGCATGTAPASGTYAAYSSTSFIDGSSGAEWKNVLSQDFTVPAVVFGGTLSLDWTATFAGDGNYQDLGVLVLIFRGGTVLDQFNLVFDPSSGATDPWTLFTHDISSVLTANAGQTLTLELWSALVLPGPGDSATLNTGFDNVDIEAQNAPEPAAVWLALGGVALLLLKSRVRRHVMPNGRAIAKD